MSFSQKYDTKNWAFFQYDSKMFFNMTRRIEPFFFTWLKDFSQKPQRIWLVYDLNLKYFSEKNDSKNWSLFHYDSQKWIFFEVRIRPTELNFFENDFFRHWTFFFEYDSKNWNSLIRLRGFNFFSVIWLKVLNFFLYDSLNWTFSRNMIWLIELNLFMNLFSRWLKELKSFFQYDAKNWTFLVFQCDSKNWNLFSQNVSKNLTSLSYELFFNRTQRT